MTTNRRVSFVVLLALVPLAVAGVALAGTSTSSSGQGRRAHEPGSTVNRGAAIADARERMRSFEPPPGSHRVHALPKSLHLDKPSLTIGSPRFIDVDDYWISSEPVTRVRDYLEQHAPTGSRLELTSEAGGRSGTYRWDYGYEWPELPNVADSRILLVGVVARPSGGSAIRADAQATYVEPKPKDEMVPTGAGYLEAEEVLGRKVRIVGTASAAKIEATAQLIDDFPIVQEDGFVECGAIPAERVMLKGVFRASPGGAVLAETKQELPAGHCDFVGLTIEGRKALPLYDEGERLTKALQNLLGHKYKQPLLAALEGV